MGRLNKLRPAFNKLAPGAFFFVMAETLRAEFKPKGSYIVGPATFRVEVTHDSMLRLFEQQFGHNVQYLPNDWNRCIFNLIDLIQRVKAKLIVFTPATAEQVMMRDAMAYLVNRDRTMEGALEMAKGSAIISDVLLGMNLEMFTEVLTGWLAF
jgi:hypothetical protein